jgi:hypothetical protein
VECSHQAGTLTGDYWWNLDLDANGSGTLTINPGFSEKRQPLSVPLRLAELQKAVYENHLCELPSRIGRAVPDSPRDRMRIKTTNIDKTISYEYVQPDDRNDDVVHRANRLWKVIQQCVDESLAIKGPAIPQTIR